VRKFYQLILRSELLRNTSILISGTALAQLIPILLQPVLRRYFLPEAFGAYSVYLSLVGILIVISSLRYELAIILPKRDRDAAAVFFLAVFVSFLFNVFLLFIMLIWKNSLADFLNLPAKFENYLLLVPAGTFLFSTYQSINYWLIRGKKFTAISINKFIRRGTEGSSQLAFMISKISQGLVYGDIMGQAANIVSGIYQAKKAGLSFMLFSRKKISYMIKRYAEYPKFNIIPSFMSACSYLLPALMINKFFSSEYTGYFDLSKLLLSVPMALVATSVSNVLLQRVSEKNKSGLGIRGDLYPILIFVLGAVIIEVIVIMLWSEDIFRIFFGSEWILSGTISKILVWAFGFNFIVSCFSSLFISLSRIKLLSIWQLIYFILIMSLSLFNYLSFRDFLVLYSVIEVFCCLLSASFIFYIVRAYEKKLELIG